VLESALGVAVVSLLHAAARDTVLCHSAQSVAKEGKEKAVNHSKERQMDGCFSAGQGKLECSGDGCMRTR
jgi:hypothetical protein